jgi:hypothetical protein
MMLYIGTLSELKSIQIQSFNTTILIIEIKDMATNLVDILTGTQLGCFSTISIPNEVEILLVIIFNYHAIYI